MRIGTYLGIPLKVNPFFFLLLAVALYYGKLAEALVLFSIVLWHETFHVIAARLYRLDVIDIELLPFGGVARLDALLQLNPQIEWVVAIVGPASNLLLILIGYGLWPFIDVPLEWFDFFVQANLGMALFNLLPALPLDGGRVLRSFLVRRQGFKEATTIASTIGQVFSVALVGWGGYGLYLGQYNTFIFVFSGLMLYWTARQEQKNASYIFLRYLTHKKQELRLRRVFLGRELVATVETSLGEVLRYFQPPHYHLIWVVDLDGQVLGFLGELELIQALFDQGLSCKIGSLVKYKL